MIPGPSLQLLSLSAVPAYRRLMCVVLVIGAGMVGDVARGAVSPGQVPDDWAFRPAERPAVPEVNADAAAWVRNPIDAFVVAKLREKGLSPSPEADRRNLIRRITFDLTGLAPTPEETQAFVADRSPDAYEKVVKRLLASPHFGERWGQHWLDVVRFADSNGYEHDGD